jgi:hypothetical protein
VDGKECCSGVCKDGACAPACGEVGCSRRGQVLLLRGVGFGVRERGDRALRQPLRVAASSRAPRGRSPAIAAPRPGLCVMLCRGASSKLPSLSAG